MVLNDRLHISVYCRWKIFANPILIFPILRPYKLCKGDALLYNRLYSLGPFIIHPVISFFFIISLILFLFIFLFLFLFLVLVGLLASLSSV